jgi:hypothetical protein
MKSMSTNKEARRHISHLKRVYENTTPNVPELGSASEEENEQQDSLTLSNLSENICVDRTHLVTYGTAPPSF